MHDAIDEYLAALARSLDVHPRRKARILVELRDHLRESAAAHGLAEAIARLGTPTEVARSFTPGRTDRLWNARDRLAALIMIVALLGCLPLAIDLWRTNHGDRDVELYALFLAPAVLLAVASTTLVLLQRPSGRRLVVPLAAVVGVTALVTLANLPPVGAALDGYRSAVTHGYHAYGATDCRGRAFSECAADHAEEIRINFTAGAVALMLLYAWAVRGWTLRLRRHRGDARQIA